MNSYRITVSLAFASLLPIAQANAAQVEIAGPLGSAAFGRHVEVLPNGNTVIVDQDATVGVAKAGAVYLVSPTGTLIGGVTGARAGDQVGSGGITVLANGNFVVSSPQVDAANAVDVGAATWFDGAAGAPGPVSAANSLVGTSTDDGVALHVVALPNGNYVVARYSWDGPGAPGAGAVTFGNGATGVKGTVSAANSLVGTAASSLVGIGGVVVLANGNYVVRSQLWNSRGAATFGRADIGVVGAVSSSNSLIGLLNEQADKVYALTNGNYVVTSPKWGGGRGAATFGNGTTGTVGTVDASNSLVGSGTTHAIGNDGVTALSNGNYVVRSSNFGDAVPDLGAVTWGNGISGTVGTVTAANSIIGGKQGDRIGRNINFDQSTVVPLANGNYVVHTPSWDNGAIADAGAVTWGDGASGQVGVVSAGTSLVGTRELDRVGEAVVALTNGHYVVRSPAWDDGATADVGAATWGNGTTGVVGTVSAANSLVGTQAGDAIGGGSAFGDVRALDNGNYVVNSPAWNDGATTLVGAATWANGATGLIGAVTPANSLIGAASGTRTGGGGVYALPNGNYVVATPLHDNGSAIDAGAVTWGNGASGLVGVVSNANSLVGSTANDQVGSGGAFPLANSRYLVRSPLWDGSVQDASAVTLLAGNGPSAAVIGIANSLVGSTTGDDLGSTGILGYANGDYVVASNSWSNGAIDFAGAATLARGDGPGAFGPIVDAHSARGTVPGFIFVSYHPTARILAMGRMQSNRVTLLTVAAPDPLFSDGFE